MHEIDEILSEGEIQLNLSRPLIQEILDSGHTEHGHMLAQHWNLPESYCEVVRDHHKEDMTEAGTLLLLVALADKACVQQGIGLESDETLRLEATEESHALGATDIMLAELSIMLEDTIELV